MRVPHRISSSPCNLQYKRRAITLKKSSLVNFVTGHSPRATVRDFALSLPCSSSANAMLGMGVYFHNLMTFLRVHYLHVNYWFEQPIPLYLVHTLARASNGSCTRFRQRSLHRHSFIHSPKTLRNNQTSTFSVQFSSSPGWIQLFSYRASFFCIFPCVTPHHQSHPPSSFNTGGCGTP